MTGNVWRSSGAIISGRSCIEIGQQKKNFKLRMLGGSHVGFVKSYAQMVGTSQYAAGYLARPIARSTLSPAIPMLWSICSPALSLSHAMRTDAIRLEWR